MNPSEADDVGSVTLDLNDPAELLAYLPYRLGFWPEESAVFFSLRDVAPSSAGPPEWEPGVVARVDLADVGSSDGASEDFRENLLDHLLDDDAALVFLVLYTSEDLGVFENGGTETYDAELSDTELSDTELNGTYIDDTYLNETAIGSLRTAGPAANTIAWWVSDGIGSTDATMWVVRADSFRCVKCANRGCCPPQGRPLAALQMSRISAAMVLSGRGYMPSRQALVPEVDVPTRLRTSANRAAARWRAKEPAGDSARRVWLGDLAREWDRALSSTTAPSRLAPTSLGAMLVGVHDPRVRDALLISAATSERVTRALGPESSMLLDQIFGPTAPNPGRERHERLVQLATYLAGVSPQGKAADPWGVLAWLSWYQGDGARADLCVRRCLEQDPDHRLGMLIRRAVDCGIPPGWARASRAA